MAKLQRLTKEDLREGLRIGVGDLETVTLDASFGRLLCGTIKEIGKEPQVFRIDRYPGYKKEPWNDRDLAQDLREAINQLHVVVFYNGLDFDGPFLTSRLLHHNLEPVSPAVQWVDPLLLVRKRLRLGQNTLARALDFLHCDEQKLHIGPEVWQRAAAGSKRDMDLLVKRNISDVVALEQLFNKLVSLMPVKFQYVR